MCSEIIDLPKCNLRANLKEKKDFLNISCRFSKLNRRYHLWFYEFLYLWKKKFLGPRKMKMKQKKPNLYVELCTRLFISNFSNCFRTILRLNNENISVKFWFQSHIVIISDHFIEFYSEANKNKQHKNNNLLFECSTRCDWTFIESNEQPFGNWHLNIFPARATHKKRCKKMHDTI